ncbi:uncharacterized protein LOC144149258 [Haemaphysalis longicornis]
MYQVLIGFVAAAASCVGTPAVPAFEPWPPITPILLERSGHLHKPPDFPQASLLHLRDRQMANHRGTFPDPVQDHKKELPSERRLGHDTFFGPHSRYIMYQVLIGFVAAAASCVGTPAVPAFEPWPPITPILLSAAVIFTSHRTSRKHPCFTFETDRWPTIVEHFRIRFKTIKRSCLANVDWGTTLFSARTHAISCTRGQELGRQQHRCGSLSSIRWRRRRSRPHPGRENYFRELKYN